MKNKLKHISLLGILLLGNMLAHACPVCEKQQPKITQGITHGAGPQSNWDWVIIAAIAIITILTFFFP